MQVGESDSFPGTASGVWNKACWPFSYWWCKSHSQKLTSSSSKRQELYQGLARLTSKPLMQHRLHGYAHECAYTLLAILHNRHPVSEQNEKALQIRRHKSVFLILIHLLFKTRARPQLLLHQAPLEIKSPFTIIQRKAQKKRSPRRTEAPSYNHLPSLGGDSMKDPPSVI